MTELIIPIGMPGCGKSTWAEGLKEKGYAVHSSDVIRILRGLPAMDTSVFDELRSNIKADLEQGISCICDATNLSRKYRLRTISSVRTPDTHVKAVLFVSDLNKCKQRNANRTGSACVPDYVYDRMLRNFHVPLKSEGYDEIEIIWDNEECKPLSGLDEFKQDNHHHTLSLGEHISKTAGYVAKHSPDEKLFWAAHLHDIGKAVTKKFENAKGEPTDEAHYYGHERAGAYLLLERCGYLREKFSDEDMLEIATLIEFHMRPFVWAKSDKALEKDRRLIGDRLVDELILLHEGDVAAK